MKSSILLVVFTAAASLSSSGATGDEIPPASDLRRAFVTIPYSELRALWEAGQRRSEPPKPEPDTAPVPLWSIARTTASRLEINPARSTWITRSRP